MAASKLSWRPRRGRLRTEKSRLRRSLMSLCDQMRQIRHLPIQEQVDALRNSPWALLTALQEISEHCRGCTGLLSVTGARCSVAAAGQAVTLPGPPSIGSRRGSLCSDHDCGCPTGRCRLSQCLESTPKSIVQEICTLRSVEAEAGDCLPVCGNGATVEPVRHRGGNRYVPPTATAPHLDSTVKASSCRQGSAAVLRSVRRPSPEDAATSRRSSKENRGYMRM